MKPVAIDSKLAVYLSWIIAGILVLLPFHAFLTTWGGSQTGLLDLWVVWKEIIMLAILPMAAILIIKSPKLKGLILESWLSRLIVAYLGIQLIFGVAAFSSQQVDGDALLHSWIINLRFLGFFVICYVAATYSDFLKKHWARILLVPSIFVLAFGVIQKFLLPTDFLRHFGYSLETIPAYQTIDANIDYRRIQSTLRGANPLGSYLVLIIPALAVVLGKKRLLQISGLLVATAVLFYSYSRSAWIGTLLATGLLAYFLAERSRRLIGPLLVASLAIIFAATGLYLLRANNGISNILLHTSEYSVSAQSSNQARLIALENSAKDVINNPLGRGPGTAGPASFRNDLSNPRIAENYYLQLAQEVGILGAAIFIAINVAVAISLWQRRADSLALVLLVSLVGLSFVNLISHAWTDDTISLIWWGLAGIALAPAILKPRHKQNVQNH